jgi:hypothetical protein
MVPDKKKHFFFNQEMDQFFVKAILIALMFAITPCQPIDNECVKYKHLFNKMSFSTLEVC